MLSQMAHLFFSLVQFHLKTLYFVSDNRMKNVCSLFTMIIILCCVCLPVGSLNKNITIRRAFSSVLGNIGLIFISFKVTPNLRGCPPEKSHMRAVFNETPRNYVSVEML